MPDLLVKLYDGRDVPEPLESKVVRYAVIVKRIETLKERRRANH